jgi:hypothetical protein
MPGPYNALSNPLAYIKEISAINERQKAEMRARAQQEMLANAQRQAAEYHARQRSMQQQMAQRGQPRIAPSPITNESQEAERVATLMMQMKQGFPVDLNEVPEQYVHVRRNALAQ